jgi:U3 small nucleolar RNA-associated protein 25
MAKKPGSHRVSKSKYGHKKGSRNGYRAERFASSRLTEFEDAALEPSNPQRNSEENVGTSDDSSDEGSIQDENASVNPYHSLLQSLSTSTQPRKVEDLPRRQHTTKHALSNGTDTQDDLINQEPNPLEESADHGSEDDVEWNDETGTAAGKPGSQNTPSILIPAESDAFNEHFGRPEEPELQEHARDLERPPLQISAIELKGGWRSKLIGSRSSRVSDSRFRQIPEGLSALKLGVWLFVCCGLGLMGIQIKQRLRGKADSILTAAQEVETYWAGLLFAYIDVLLSDRQRIDNNRLCQLVGLHALNHVLKTRDRVLRNNERAIQDAGLDDGQLCDQGFTRPKVLFLLPTRRSCYRMASAVISLYGPEQQENKKRFEENFGGKGESISGSKPQDFRDLFEGNDDDMFRVGLKFTRKTAKLFAQFYNSDMIFASPLGLRMAIGDQESKKQDYDFLSSIEVVIVDQTEALLMQNWEHVEYIFDHLNLQPREAHGCDFGRVRPWYLDGNARYVRQTIALTAYNTPETNNLFNSRMLNYAGKVKVSQAVYSGLISAPNALFKQTFFRFEATSPSAEPDARFAYFTAKIVPQMVKRARDNSTREQGTFIFIPSYMDFVRIRNFFGNSTTTRDVSFGSMSEYTEAPDVARARSHFMKGRHGVVLYTGRLHHFRRYQVKGAKQVIFYGLPDNPVFYKELASDNPALGVSAGKVDPAEIRVQVLFSRYDALRLERIVGTERLRTMLRGDRGDVFEFIP